MKWFLAAAWILTLGAAVGIGHHLAGDKPYQSEPQPGVTPVDHVESTVESALSDALRERALLTRTVRLVESLRRLDEHNIDAAVAVVEAQRVGVTPSEARLFLYAWSRFDPAGAFEWANDWRGPLRKTLTTAAIYAWGFREPQAAVTALNELKANWRDDLHGSLVSGWARSGDIAGLTDYLMSRPANNERSRFLGLLLAELSQRGDAPNAIRSWAESVPTDAPNQAKVAAFLTAGGALAQKDPTRAAALFEAHQQFEYAQPALKTIARRWVDYHDPRDLFAWLVTLPAGESRNGAVNAGFSRWWSSKPQKARAWLVESSPGAALDPAVVVFARETSRVSPARAIEWADGIHNPKLRRRTIAPILRLWVGENRKAARAWMDEHEIPEELQREFLNPAG